MKVCAIICEYNPFHNGHYYQIQEVKKRLDCDIIVCIMSPNFTQRCEPAIFSKWDRSKIAILNGADLVIELPLISAISSAKDFAYGAVEILSRLNCIDYLVFGAETDNISIFNNICTYINSPEFSIDIKQYLKNGDSFVKSREKAIKGKFNIDPAIINSPNNILGIEYISALINLKSTVKPYIIRRHKSGYHDDFSTENFASASYIRTAISNINTIENLVPKNAFNIYKDLILNKHYTDFNKFDSFCMYKLSQCSPNDFKNNPFAIEGIENRILNATTKYTNIKNIISFSNSRRYSNSLIRRIILAQLLNYQNELHNVPQQYARILSLNKKITPYLKQISKNSDIPIITKSSTIKKISNLANDIFNLENRATNMWATCQKKPLPFNIEYKISPYIYE